MKRLAVIGLACLLSACQSTHLLEGPPDKTASFPLMTADLSDCVHRSAQSMRSPYWFRRHARADNLEFVVTATGPHAPIASKFPQLELRFLTQGATTIVEMRDNATGDHELSDETWAFVERCAHQVDRPSAPTSPLPKTVPLSR